MAYVTGTLTSANPAADLYTQQIAPALTAAGFTLVDTVAIGARTHTVWKSAAANNSQGLDWYLDVYYTTTGLGGVWFGCFEYYDPATHLGYRGLNKGTSSTVESTYYSQYGANGYALETNWWVATTGNQLQLSTSAFTYWISITQDRVIGMTSIAPTFIVSCGFYVPSAEFLAKVGSANFPLWAGHPNPAVGYAGGTNGSLASITRMPLVTSASSLPWYYGPFLGFGSAIEATAAVGDVTGVNNTSRVGVTGPRGGSINFGWDPDLSGPTGGVSWTFTRAGMVRDVCYFGAGSSVTRGDTVTIDGVQWVLSNAVVSSVCFGFKAS